MPSSAPVTLTPDTVPDDAQARAPAPRLARRDPRKLGVIVALWAVAAMGGLAWVMKTNQAAGRSAIAPVTWPERSSLARDGTKPTLVMVLHPKCSCSRASVGELARLMTRLPNRIAVHVLVVRPDGVDDAWAKSDLYASASAIPGVSVHVDVSGAEAKRFGALTSGQTYLYSPTGELLFSGGVTVSRGHHGDNAGSNTIAAIVNAEMRGRADVPATNVYGCEIPDPGSEPTN